MFTGIVEEMGTVVQVQGAASDGRRRLVVQAPAASKDLGIGESIAVNGVCLTAVAVDGDRFAVDVTAETLRRTTLGALAAGERVNLERALRLGDRLGGHLVQGHVDGVGTIAGVAPDGDGVAMVIAAPPGIMRYVVEKGSVAVDGVSLTVAGRSTDRFWVALIPHTLAATTLGQARPGRQVNLEADLIGKYVEGLLAARGESAGITDAFLREHGFV